MSRTECPLVLSVGKLTEEGAISFHHYIKSLPVQESGSIKCVGVFYALDMCAISGVDYMWEMINVKKFPLYSDQVFLFCRKVYNFRWPWKRLHTYVMQSSSYCLETAYSAKAQCTKLERRGKIVIRSIVSRLDAISNDIEDVHHSGSSEAILPSKIHFIICLQRICSIPKYRVSSKSTVKD